MTGPWDDAWLKALLRLFSRLRRHWAERRYRNLLATEAPSVIDIVLVLKGEALSPLTLRRLRAHYPTARFALYLWDSTANTPTPTTKLVAYDVLYSQDPEDCRSHPVLHYRPLFLCLRMRRPAALAPAALAASSFSL